MKNEQFLLLRIDSFIGINTVNCERLVLTLVYMDFTHPANFMTMPYTVLIVYTVYFIYMLKYC